MESWAGQRSCGDMCVFKREFGWGDRVAGSNRIPKREFENEGLAVRLLPVVGGMARVVSKLAFGQGET